MAGDWIKIRPSLVTSPKVKGIVKHLESNPEACKALAPGFNGNINEVVTRNVMRNVTVTLLVTIWGAANEHSVNGVFNNYDLSDIDDLVGVPGFGKAMESVGWLIYDAENGTVTLPNFNEHNTCDADRTKESNRERQRKYREKKKARNVTNNVTSNVTNNVISNDRIEENRIEENKEKENPSSDDDSPSPVPKQEQLDLLIDSWNKLDESIAPAVVKRDSDSIISGWRKVQRTRALREAFADIPILMTKIRDGTFMHGENWFVFVWLFGKKNGEWNVIKILEGRFRDKKKGYQNERRDPARVESHSTGHKLFE